MVLPQRTLRRKWRSGRMVVASVVLGCQILLVTLITSQLYAASAEQTPLVTRQTTRPVAPDIVQLDYPVHQLSLAVNQSLAIKLKQPIKRAAVASEEVASVSVVSPKMVLITGRSFGFTQLILWDQQGEQQVFDVRVDVDVQRLQHILQDAEPRAKLKISTILDSIVLAGTVPDAVAAQRLLDLAKVFSQKVHNQLYVAGTQQVMLKATVAEVTREAIRTLGLNGTFFGAKAFGGSNLNMINPTSIGLQERTLVPVDVPNRFQVIGSDLLVAPTTTLYFGLPRAQLELFLQAMAENSLIRVLAEPNLVSLSGQEAEFLAGGELPVPVPTEAGIAITFREFGVRLKFRPVVQLGDMIRLTITSEVSEPDFTNAVQISGLTIPGLTKRNTQTVVEVGSGQTFAIAGLLSDNVRGIANRVPGVGDLPVLGALFRSVRFEREESELLVLITPQLAEPLNPQQVAYYPGHDVAAPSDWQLYGLGMLQDDTYTPPTTQPAQTPAKPPLNLRGPWGYQLTPDGAEIPVTQAADTP